jgi:hypothetical protein
VHCLTVLQRGEVDVIVLEAGADISGVWSKQYTSLKITTRRAHCGLPHYPVPQSYAADTAQRAGHGSATHSTDGKLSCKLQSLSYELLAIPIAPLMSKGEYAHTSDT